MSYTEGPGGSTNLLSRELTPLVQLLTWSTLAFELHLPILVWTPRLRPYLLVAGILFHAGIEITIPMFSSGSPRRSGARALCRLEAGRDRRERGRRTPPDCT